MCKNILPACVCMYHVCEQCTQRPEEGAGSPEIGVITTIGEQGIKQTRGLRENSYYS